ncbi:MAG: GNAT family N-acetyltransferase [Cytophagales bacterium]|nr:GNAT family N-acetyltransferase [Cytophagales bacterium]
MVLTDNYTLVPAANKDIQEIKAVIFSVLNEYGLKEDEGSTDSDLSDIQTNYMDNNGFFGKIMTENKLVGTVGLLKLNEDTCELRKMYLLREHRGKGLGKILMDKIIKIAKEKKYRKIELETASVLKEAIKLYEKYGFREMEKLNLAKRCDKAYILELK